MLSLFLLASCQQEDLPMQAVCGYLSINEITIQTSQVDVIPARADEEDIPLTVELWKGKDKLKDLSETELQNKIQLEAGEDYRLVAYSSNYHTGMNWADEEKGEPLFYGEFPFVVESGKTTLVNANVPMINFGVRLALPENFAELFPTSTFTVTSGRNVTLADGEIAYFPYSERITFTYTLDVTNTDGEPQTDEGIYGAEEGKTISAGTVYTVTYEMETRSLSVAQ